MTGSDRPSKRPLPTNSKSTEIATVAAKGAVSAIPLAGGAISEFIAAAVGLPLSKRRDEWLRDLEARLKELEQQIGGFSLDTLADNEQFVSTTVQATQAALRTHQKEKIEALQNAVLNTAVHQGPQDDYLTVFLSLIDRLTPAHLRILKSFHSPTLTRQSGADYLRWKLDATQAQNKRWPHDLLRWVRDYVPGFQKTPQEFIQILLADLNSAGLTNPGIPEVAGGRTQNAINSPPRSATEHIDNLPDGEQWTTELGSQFLKFIESPNKKS